MKKLLVTGISGFLGHYVQNHRQEDWQIVGTYFQHADFPGAEQHRSLNLCHRSEIQKCIESVQPDGILHLAACSQPNFCEQHPKLSHTINVEVTAELCRLAAERKIPFVFTSTDLVFDGKNGWYSEEDQAAPVNLYGRQKREAEQQVQRIYPNATIARLPLLYGNVAHRNNFMSNWLQQLQSGKAIRAFSDEYRTSVSGRDGATGLFMLLQKNVSGIWHLGGEERMSRYTFALKLAEFFGYPEKLIVSSLQAEVKMAAARPRDVSLDSSKAGNLGYRPGRVAEALAHFNKNRKSGA